MIAALFVLPDGPYADIPGVDLWDKARDARLYGGPYPVVAHPPCERWGRYWYGSPSSPKRLAKGDDGGCFAAALNAVRTWGGVLEHPAGSGAWEAFGLNPPPRCGGWVNADFEGGWTCAVDQSYYGHRAQKATWLYVCGIDPLPRLIWDKAKSSVPREHGRRAIRRGVLEKMSKRQRAMTPEGFRDLLIAMAMTVITKAEVQTS